MLPGITLSVTVPHTLSLPDQVYVHQQSLHLNTKSSDMKITYTCFQLANFDAYLQMRLAELLEEEGTDIIQTEGGNVLALQSLECWD